MPEQIEPDIAIWTEKGRQKGKEIMDKCAAENKRKAELILNGARKSGALIYGGGKCQSK